MMFGNPAFISKVTYVIIAEQSLIIYQQYRPSNRVIKKPVAAMVTIFCCPL